MTQRQYIVNKVNGNLDNFTNDNIWNGIAVLKITDYLWIPNNYKPYVFIQVLYSDDYFYLKFNVMEEKISIRYTNINDPVYKDSCVEFFINLFPEITEEYFNFEFNALGCLLYTSDAADERSSVDLGGRRIIKKKTNRHTSAS